MADIGTGWERERRAHFDEIVARYDSVRPEYPGALFGDILEYAGEARGKKALEIGAGTGKATAPFLGAGYGVTAVEIGENMADFLREKYSGYDDFRVIVSAFEEAPLEEDSYDLVYAASAFHWVDAQIGCPKVFRLLKSGGVFALLRYNFDFYPIGNGEPDKEIQAAYEKYYYRHYQLKGRPSGMSKEQLERCPKIRSGYGFEDMGAYGFEDIAMRFYDGARTYSAQEWVAMLDTLSDHRKLPEEDRLALYADVEEAIMRHGGQRQLDIIFQLYMGRKP